MKKVWGAVRKDLWIVVLDMISVNVSYLLALLIRFHSLMSQTTKKALKFA